MQNVSLGQQIPGPPGVTVQPTCVNSQQTPLLQEDPEQQSVSEAQGWPLHWAAAVRGQTLSTAIRATRRMGTSRVACRERVMRVSSF